MKVTDIFFFMNMFSGMGFSILAPLFPSMALKHGLSESLIGWILGIFAFSSTCISPFTPSLIKKFSRIKLLYFSTFCEATSTLLYGLIGFINSYYGLLFFMFIIRIIHGCCCGIIGTVIYSLTITLSKPAEEKKALGNLEVAWCIGITTGPLFASIFYKIGGYFLPFIVLGLFLYTSFFLTTRVAQEKTESEEEIKDDPPFLKYMTHLDVLIILGVFLAGYISQSFFYPCLSLHLKKQFDLSVSGSSLFLTIIALSNLTVLQFLDSISQKFGLYGTTCIGLVIVSLGDLMIYPYPPIPKSIFILILGFILIGGGGVPIFIPGIVSLKNTIKKIDTSIDDFTVNDITSAINFLTINIGDFLGPVVGGNLSSLLGLKNCCLILTCFVLFYCIIYFIYFHKFIFEKKKKKESKLQSDENELITHPGFYKKNTTEEILFANQEYQPILRRNSSRPLVIISSMNEQEYDSLNDLT